MPSFALYCKLKSTEMQGRGKVFYVGGAGGGV